MQAGLIILALYLAATAFTGNIYRPRGVELDAPAFYLLMLIPLVADRHADPDSPGQGFTVSTPSHGSSTVPVAALRVAVSGAPSQLAVKVAAATSGMYTT